MTDPIIKQARKLLEIEGFYARNHRRSREFVETTLGRALVLTAAQRLESRALQVTYAAAQADFTANPTLETATRLVDAHQNQSNFKRESGFQFESLSAFYAYETLEYAHRLLATEDYLLRNQRQFLLRFTATTLREDGLTGEQRSILHTSREAYANARLRFQRNETPETAVKMSITYESYASAKENLGFSSNFHSTYDERVLPVDLVDSATADRQMPLLEELPAFEVDPQHRMAPAVEPVAVVVDNRRLFANTDMARDAEEFRRIAMRSIRRFGE